KAVALALCAALIVLAWWLQRSSVDRPAASSAPAATSEPRAPDGDDRLGLEGGSRASSEARVPSAPAAPAREAKEPPSLPSRPRTLTLIARFVDPAAFQVTVEEGTLILRR